MKLRKRLCGIWIGLSLCAANATAQAANYVLTPSYAGWGSYGTGDGGAAIYNDGSGFKTLMIVGNTSAGGSRQVGIWDNLTVAASIGIGMTNPESTLTVDGDILAYGLNGSGSGPFTASIYGGSSSDGVFLGDYGVRHAGIKWNGTSLDFLNATSWGPDTDTWTGYVPLFTMNYQTNNVGIGTTNPQAKLEINGNLRFTADGSVQTTAWTGVLCGGDYAEDMRADQKKESYEPGDVLVLTSDDNSDVQKSVEPYSTMVAGIYATKPGVVGLRDAVAKSADNVPMAMVGVVPTKVTTENGSIHKGDLLVTSSLKGYAMKGTDRSRMLGAVIGKAMGSLDSGTGVIEVLVTLQ